jgi:hypothetical protein
MFCFALTGLNIIERWGRRPSLMVSSTGMTISVAMITAMTALTPTHPRAGVVGITFLYVFLASKSPRLTTAKTLVFAFFWTPLQALYPVEVLTFANRAKGFAYYGFLNNAIKVFNTCMYCSQTLKKDTDLLRCTATGNQKSRLAFLYPIYYSGCDWTGLHLSLVSTFDIVK